MRSSLGRTSVVVPFVLLAAAAAAHSDEARERALRAEMEAALARLMDLERAVEHEKRFYPPADMWQDEVTNLMSGARAAGLPGVVPVPVAGEPIRLEGGRPSGLELRRLTLAGQAEYDALHRFLAFLARPTRRADVEALDVAAAPNGMVAYTLRLGLPVYVGEAPLPPAPPPPISTTGARTPEEARDMAREAVFRARLAALAERAAHIESLQRLFARLEERHARARSLAALARVHRATAGLELALTALRLGDALTLEGVAVGAAARAGLATALAEAGLGGRELPFSRLGSCHRFTVTAPLPPPLEGVEGVEGRPFDAATAAACAAAEGRMRGRIAARGADPAGLTVRLRGVDVPDLFRVLADATPLGFVVDGDVDGRVDVDYEQAGLAPAFEAMKAAGIVGQVGALVRVSNVSAGATVQQPAQEHTGEPVTLDLKQADARDVFRLFEHVSGLRYDLPPDFHGYLSLFARDQPWDRLVAATADASGLRHRIEGTRVVLERKGTPRAPGPPPAGGRVPRQPARIGVEDLQPVGAALIAGTWHAYAYSPGRVLWALLPGARFFDGEVKGVTATAVTFDVGGRSVEMKLP